MQRINRSVITPDKMKTWCGYLLQCGHFFVILSVILRTFKYISKEKCVSHLTLSEFYFASICCAGADTVHGLSRTKDMSRMAFIVIQIQCTLTIN